MVVGFVDKRFEGDFRRSYGLWMSGGFHRLPLRTEGDPQRRGVWVLVPPKDPEKLAQGILQVLENRDLQRELSERGKQRALDFTVEKAVEEYVRLIERCCRSGDSLG